MNREQMADGKLRNGACHTLHNILSSSSFVVSSLAGATHLGLKVHLFPFTATRSVFRWWFTTRPT